MWCPDVLRRLDLFWGLSWGMSIDQSIYNGNNSNTVNTCVMWRHTRGLERPDVTRVALARHPRDALCMPPCKSAWVRILLCRTERTDFGIKCNCLVFLLIFLYTDKKQRSNCNKQYNIISKRSAAAHFHRPVSWTMENSNGNVLLHWR